MAVIYKYAIRHKPTGGYLPEPSGRMGRGGSYVEPMIPIPGELTTYPRMFPTKRGAINALSQWLRGKHHMEYEYEECFGRDVRVEAGCSIEHVPHRDKDSMEIVALAINI